MAYGVKFRLDFEDHEGNGRRLDILKDGYTGEILPLVGGEDPVKIKWDGDDDFYSPIIGSTCNISLYQTDETNYDDFFNEPEREYKVEVYVAQTVRDAYKTRSQQDGGIVEADNCVDSSFIGYLDTQTAFNDRVLDDGGTVEGGTCFSKHLTIETVDDYRLFWTGWLLSDQFAEVLAPNPQPINITAVDGLGELDSVFVDNTFYTVNTFGNRIEGSLASILCAGLNKTGLDLDVLINSDFEYIDIFLNRQSFITYVNTFLNEHIFLSDDYEFFNVKEYLSNILKNVNARVFQANGRWVILNNSTYSEQAVLDYVRNYVDDNTAIPSGIGTMRQEYLKGDIEKLKFLRFNNSGTLQGDYYHEGLRTVRTELQPLEQNLTREAERGYKAIRSDIGEYKSDVTYNNDASFEFQNTNHWTITSGSFTTDEVSKNGNRSFKTTAINTGATPSNIAITGDYSGRRSKAMKLRLSYYYDTNNASQSTSLYNKFWCQIYFTSGSTYYYDTANKNWTTTVKYFFFEDDRFSADKWVSQELEIAELPIAAAQSQIVNLRIYGPQNYLTNYQGVYIDDTILYIDQPTTEAAKYTLTQDTTTNTIIGDLEIERFLSGIVIDNTTVVASWFNDVSVPYLLAQKQQLNDFRNTVTRYEGTLYNLQTEPLTPMDKIRINFTNFSEGDSLILDGLEYSLRKNRYDIIAHKPNQDNPVDATLTTKYNTVVKT